MQEWIFHERNGCLLLKAAASCQRRTQYVTGHLGVHTLSGVFWINEQHIVLLHAFVMRAACATRSHPVSGQLLSLTNANLADVRLR